MNPARGNEWMTVLMLARAARNVLADLDPGEAPPLVTAETPTGRQFAVTGSRINTNGDLVLILDPAQL